MNEIEAKIIGLGAYVPEKILSNSDLEKLVDTSDDWIIQRTGIAERRVAAANEQPSDMGVKAAEVALQRGGMRAEDIDVILVTTMTPDQPLPSTAAIIQKKLGAKGAAILDINAACSGFVYGISIAKAYVESGLFRTILLVSTEKMSSLVDYQDRTTCILFGDGSSAALISADGPGLAISSVFIGGDGAHADLAKVPAGGAAMPATEQTVKDRLHYFQMNGKEVYKFAVRGMEASARDCLEKTGLKQEEIRWVVPHQANTRIMGALARNLEIPEEKVYKTIRKFGNTSSASIGITLNELMQNETPQAGDNILLVAFGMGLTWGSAMLKVV